MSEPVRADFDARHVDADAFLDHHDEYEHSGNDVGAIARTKLKNGVYGSLLWWVGSGLVDGAGSATGA